MSGKKVYTRDFDIDSSTPWMPKNADPKKWDAKYGKAPDSFKVGEAPWEKEEAQQEEAPESFKVGEAPWEESPPQETLLHKGLSGLHKGLKALTYPGNVARGLIAKGIEKVGGKDLHPGSMEEILKGHTPSSDELLGRTGMPPGLKRQALGFVSDVAMDPLTWVGGLVPKIVGAGSRAAETVSNVALNPISKGLEKTGAGIYKNAVRNLDANAISKGEKLVSPHMLKQGMTGGYEALNQQMADRMRKLVNERQGIYSKLEQSGETIVPQDATKDAAEFLLKKSDDEYLAPEVNSLFDHMIRAQKPMSFSKASDVKSNLYSSLPQSAFRGDKPTSVANQYMMKMGSGYRKEIINKARAAEEKLLTKGLANRIGLINEELGPYLGARGSVLNETAKDLRKPIMGTSKVDAMALDYSPEMWMAKQAAGLLDKPAITTRAGWVLNRAGKWVPETAYRRAIIGPNKNDN